MVYVIDTGEETSEFSFKYKLFSINNIKFKGELMLSEQVSKLT